MGECHRCGRYSRRVYEIVTDDPRLRVLAIPLIKAITASVRVQFHNCAMPSTVDRSSGVTRQDKRIDLRSPIRNRPSISRPTYTAFPPLWNPKWNTHAP